MLIEKLEQGENFTSHEKEVAQYILANPDKVPGMSSMELARASFTSKATVVRLCQKIGLAGYQEFRLKLVEEMNQKNRLSQMLAGEPMHDKSTYKDIINTLPVLYDKAITNTRLSLDKNSMNRSALIFTELESAIYWRSRLPLNSPRWGWSALHMKALTGIIWRPGRIRKPLLF